MKGFLRSHLASYPSSLPGSRFAGTTTATSYSSLDEILGAFGERLQVQNIGPGVRWLSAPRLAERTAVFVAGLAVNLRGLVEYAALEAELMGRVRALDSGPPGEQQQVIDLIRACLVLARAHSVRGLREVGSRL